MFSEFPDVVSIAQLCQMLHIGKNTAYNLINNGYIKSIRVGRVHKIIKSNVIEYLENIQ